MARFSFEGFNMEGISEKDMEKRSINKVLVNNLSNNDDKEVRPEDFERKSDDVVNEVKEREITEADFDFDANTISVKKDEDQDEFIDFDC